MNNLPSSSIRRDSSDDFSDSRKEFDFQKISSLNVEHDIENQYEKLTASERVSFKENGSGQKQTSSKCGEDDQVLRCTSNVSCQAEDDQVLRCTSNTSCQAEDDQVLRCTLNASCQAEDVPFDDEDLPDEYKTEKLSFFTLIQWVSLILIVCTLVCSLIIKKLRDKIVWRMQLWKWEVMVLMLICGGLVSGGLIRILVFFIERNFLLRRKVLYFVYGMKSSVHKFLWLCLVLLAWILVAKETTNSQVSPYVTKVLICFMVATLVWLFKTLLLKVFTKNFHVTAFLDKIEDTLFNQYVIETLSGPEQERVRKDEERDNIGIGINHLRRRNQKNISVWNMKRLMTIVRKGALSTLDKKLDLTSEDDHAVLICTEKEAKCAAKRVFRNVAGSPTARHIYLEDLKRFLREDEANRTIDLFEGQGASDGKGISKRALKNWVVKVFRERRALALSFNHTETTINQLRHFMNILVGIIVIFIWLLILGVATIHFLVILSFLAIVLVFVFGNPCKTIFEAIIFLFVMHPFDVGDRCEIDGVQMIVEEINLLATVFLRFDNLKIIYPNSILATKPINNYNRSPDMGDAIDFCVHISTPSEKISLMKEMVLRYIENKKEHWCAGARVVTRDVIDMNRMKLSVWVTHTMNHQDMGERWTRRGLLLEQMIDIFRELDIEFRELPMDVNVRNMSALASHRVPSNENF